ncbi:MAG: VOC family protein, partial [Myxococcota bacterium]
DWLCSVFGFSVRIKVEGPNGDIRHAELDVGADGLVMVSSAGLRQESGKAYTASPKELGDKTTHSLCVQVDDVDAHFTHAKAAGAHVASPPETVDYGPEYWADRNYLVEDLEGHRWWFVQRIRGPGAP